jgi:uncharacterized coiled-coil protein SlyX
VFEFLKKQAQGISEALSGGNDLQVEKKLRERIREIELQLERRRAILAARYQQRIDALYPKERQSDWRPEHYEDLAPINFATAGEESLLASVANSVIDRFPGGQTLLSQLDLSLRAFTEANCIEISTETPYSELLAARDRIARAFDLELRPPLFVGSGCGNEVRGCSDPIIVLDRLTLDGLEPIERELFLATQLGHFYFGNLKIFAFHRLMGILDKLPSMAGFLQKGLGMIPGFGNTISRSFELARAVNDNLIRRTNMVIGLQNHLRCDRLALLVARSPQPLLGLFTKLAYGSASGKHPELIQAVLTQGARVSERFQRGEVDMHMLGLLGPSASFAAFRAHKLNQWAESEPAKRILEGFYITRRRLREFEAQHASLESEIEREEARVFELEEELSKARSKLDNLFQRFAEEEGAGEGPASEEASSQANTRDSRAVDSSARGSDPEGSAKQGSSPNP